MKIAAILLASLLAGCATSATPPLAKALTCQKIVVNGKLVQVCPQAQKPDFCPPGHRWGPFGMLCR